MPAITIHVEHLFSMSDLGIRDSWWISWCCSSFILAPGISGPGRCTAKYRHWERGGYQDVADVVILNWRYCTICLAIFCGDISLHRPSIGLIYGRYLQFRILEWPLIHWPKVLAHFGQVSSSYRKVGFLLDDDEATLGLIIWGAQTTWLDPWLVFSWDATGLLDLFLGIFQQPSKDIILTAGK